MKETASAVVWPCVVNERGWRGCIDLEVGTLPRSIYVEFYYNGAAPPERPDARVEFHRASIKAKKWRWREGAEQEVVIDALQTAAASIARRFEWTGRR